MMTTPLTLLQARVYFIIRKHGAMGPTVLGGHLNIQYEAASATVARPLRHLVAVGLLIKTTVNKRLVMYECAHPETVAPIKILPRKDDEDDHIEHLKEIRKDAHP